MDYFIVSRILDMVRHWLKLSDACLKLAHYQQFSFLHHCPWSLDLLLSLFSWTETLTAFCILLPQQPTLVILQSTINLFSFFKSQFEGSLSWQQNDCHVSLVLINFNKSILILYLISFLPNSCSQNINITMHKQIK